MNTLREEVESRLDSDRASDRHDHIRFELNHLELHDLDDYLITCFNKSIKDVDNVNNSNIKYLLGMTDVIHEGAVVTAGGSWPDIDVDFEHTKRGRVKDHLREVYGPDHVANIGTVTFSKAKGVFKDVARIYGLDFKKSNEISKMFPEMCDSIGEALEGSEDLRKLLASDNEVSEVFEYATRLEGSVRAIGIHAAGVVISPEPVTDIVPLFESKGESVTMFDGPTLEKIGLIKYDILGLKALTVISKTIELIKLRTGEVVDIFNISEEDENAYNIVRSGNTLGIFQVEGSKALRDFAAACKPSNIGDLGAIISLYRPGPIGLGALDEYILRKSGKKASVFDIPEFNYIFEDTYGLLVYQEQLMRLSGDMCGFDDIERDVLRKATAKKDAALLASLKTKFVEGAVKHSGQNADKISALFDTMEAFSRYSFNKSHAIAYAYITYQTSWLKANYISEYMAASISCEPDAEQQSIYMADSRRNGVPVLPPDLNQSKEDFVVGTSGEILFGFSAIKGLGSRAMEKIMSLQPYTSFGDFLIRSYHAKGVNKKVIDALICSGCCDTFGYKRSCLLAGFEKFIIDYSGQCGEEYDGILAGEFIRKEEFYFVSDSLDEFPILKILEMENELLGLHISGNPFDVIGSLVRENYLSIADYNNMETGSGYALCQINKVKKIITKKGDPMAFVDVSDRNGDSTNMVVFPNVFPNIGNILVEDKYVLIYLNVKTDIRGKSFLVVNMQDLTVAVDSMSDRIEEEKNIKSIELYVDDISTVRMKSIKKKIDIYKTDNDSKYTGSTVMVLGNVKFGLEIFNLNKIDIPMLRDFSKMSGLTVKRGV